jgi:hypothetical protein
VGKEAPGLSATTASYSALAWALIITHSSLSRVEVGAQDEADGDRVQELGCGEPGGIAGDRGLLDRGLGEDVTDDVVEAVGAGAADRREGEGLAGHVVDVVVRDRVGGPVEEAAERVGPLLAGEGGLVEQLALLKGALTERVRGVGHAREDHVVGADRAGPQGERVVADRLEILLGEHDGLFAEAERDRPVARVDQRLADLVGDRDVHPRREGQRVVRREGEGEGEGGGEGGDAHVRAC